MHSLDAYRIKRKNLNALKTEPEKKNIIIHRIESPLHQIDPLMVYVLGRSFYVQKKFSEILRTEHPDVVHHHNISLLGYSLLEKKGNYLSIYTAHDYWLICQTNNLLINRKKTCTEKQCYSCVVASKRFPQIWRDSKSFKKAISSLDLLISPSDFVRRRLMQEIHLKSLTLPNFAPKPLANISPSGFSNYFLFIGMLEKHKGIIPLLDIFKELRPVLKTRLVIAGGGSLGNYVKNYIEKNSLSDMISYLGFVDQQKLYSLYADALALIVPSIWPENAPLVVLEALSLGTPVIVSNKGGLPEVNQKMNLNSLIFNDFSQLKEILLNFSKENYLPSEIKRVFEQNFSPESYVKRYIEKLSMIKIKA